MSGDETGNGNGNGDNRNGRNGNGRESELRTVIVLGTPLVLKTVQEEFARPFKDYDDFDLEDSTVYRFQTLRDTLDFCRILDEKGLEYTKDEAKRFIYYH